MFYFYFLIYFYKVYSAYLSANLLLDYFFEFYKMITAYDFLIYKCSYPYKICYKTKPSKMVRFLNARITNAMLDLSYLNFIDIMLENTGCFF